MNTLIYNFDPSYGLCCIEGRSSGTYAYGITHLCPGSIAVEVEVVQYRRILCFVCQLLRHTCTATDNSPAGGSALQCGAHAPHSPSHPSPTGDLTGKALTHLPVSLRPIGTAYMERQEPERYATRTSDATRWAYTRRAAGRDEHARGTRGGGLRQVG